MSEVIEGINSVGSNFGFRLAKYSLGGAFIGVISAAVAQLIEKKGKIVNPWYVRMKLEGLNTESLEEEMELCKIFFLLHKNYVKTDPKLREQFDFALDNTCNLNFLGDQIRKGLLTREFLPRVKDGSLNPKIDLQHDEQAYSLLEQILRSLQRLENMVAHTESEKLKKRDANYAKYLEEKTNFEQLKRKYEKAKLTLESKLMKTIDMEERKKIQTELKSLHDPGEAPEIPPDSKLELKSDRISKYITVIQTNLIRVYKYIKSQVDLFRMKNPFNRVKMDLYRLTDKSAAAVTGEEDESGDDEEESNEENDEEEDESEDVEDEEELEESEDASSDSSDSD